MVEEAASAGTHDILKYFYANELFFEDIAEFSREITWGFNDAAKAAAGGHRDIVKWLYKEVEEETRDDDETMYHAVISGDVELVKWLRAEMDIPVVGEFELAAANGHFDMAKDFLKEVRTVLGCC